MTTETQIAKVDPRQANLKGLFERSKGAIAQVLPRHLSADRILKVTLAATSRTPKLLECTQTSILQSVMQAAQLGLEPGGPLGHAYLVPFSNKVDNKWVTECQLIVGYRGLIDLARRSGQIDSIEARCVYERDKFKVSYGLDQRLEHEPFMDEDPGRLLCVYAIARIKGGLPQVEVMSKSQVDAIKAMSKTGAKGYGPWQDHYEEMARKTVVRRICKYLPLTVELATALELNENETEVDAGAFAAIPIEIADDSGPSPLNETLKAKAEAGKKKDEATPEQMQQWKAAIQEPTECASLTEVWDRIRVQPMSKPQNEELSRLFIARAEELRGHRAADAR